MVTVMAVHAVMAAHAVTVAVMAAHTVMVAVMAVHAVTLCLRARYVDDERQRRRECCHYQTAHEGLLGCDPNDHCAIGISVEPERPSDADPAYSSAEVFAVGR